MDNYFHSFSNKLVSGNRNFSYDMGGRNIWIKNTKPLCSCSGHSSVPLTYTHTLPAWDTVIYSFNCPARRWKKIVLSQKLFMRSFDHSVGLDYCTASDVRGGHPAQERFFHAFQMFASWACSCNKSQECSSATMPVNCSYHLILCVHAQTHGDVSNVYV